MTKQEAINYIENFTWGKTMLGLTRIRALLDGLHNPQDKLKFVHVAGSNGKGSTSAMIASVLTHAGYKTGFYSSPYLVDFSERIRLDGKNISDRKLAEVTEKIKTVADSLDEHPTQFELITAIGFEYFYEEGTDIVVLEVGMGGEFDATNVIASPDVCVICNIGLEHTEYLGNTIEEIAAAKGGIIKSGADVVCYDLDATATRVIKDICLKENARFFKTNFDDINIISESLDGSTFIFEANEYKISLVGRHQIYNAAVAIKVVKCLKKRGFDIDEEALKEGLASAKWPGRFEVLKKNPLFILDGGHNPQCALALASTLEEILPGKKFIFILGILADKNYKEVIDIIAPFAARFVCVTPDNPRALKSKDLAFYLKSIGLEAEVAAKYEDEMTSEREFALGIDAQKNTEIKCAIDMVLKQSKDADGIIAFGSLFLAGMVLREFGK